MTDTPLSGFDVTEISDALLIPFWSALLHFETAAGCEKWMKSRATYDG